MPDEDNKGAAYLSALRQSATPKSAGTALAPVPEMDVRPSAESQIGGEKRRSPRYRCQGSAHLREAATGAATWATFTDISLHGCYVEATTTYPQGAALKLTIEVNNFRVETRGDVRVSYPSLGMGIYFTSMSEQDRDRLRELLRSLSRPSVILGAASPLRPAPFVPAASAAPPDTSVPINDATAAVQAVVKFFEQRQILTREEFVRIIRKSQTKQPG